MLLFLSLSLCFAVSFGSEPEFLGRFAIFGFSQVGKSSFIKALAESCRQDEISKEIAIGDPIIRKSTTKKAAMYSLFNCALLGGKSIELIDLPGLSNNVMTDANLSDEDIEAQLSELIFDHLSCEINVESGSARIIGETDIKGVILLDSIVEYTKVRHLLLSLQRIFGSEAANHIILIQSKVDTVKSLATRKAKFDALGSICKGLSISRVVYWTRDYLISDADKIKDDFYNRTNMINNIVEALGSTESITIKTLENAIHAWIAEAHELYATQAQEYGTVQKSEITLQQYDHHYQTIRVCSTMVALSAEERLERALELQAKDSPLIEERPVLVGYEKIAVTHGEVVTGRVSNPVGKFLGERKKKIEPRIEYIDGAPIYKMENIAIMKPIESYLALVPESEARLVECLATESISLQKVHSYNSKDVQVALPPRPITDFIEIAKHSVKRKRLELLRRN